MLPSLLLFPPFSSLSSSQVEHYNGRIIAVDASMAIYQFLVRKEGRETGREEGANKNNEGRGKGTGV